MLTNDVAELSGVVKLTSANVTLDTDGRDCSFKYLELVSFDFFLPDLYMHYLQAETYNQGTHSNFIFKFRFPCPTTNFLGRLIHLKKGNLLTFSQQNSKYLLHLESRNLQLEQTKFPVFWQNFHTLRFRCQGIL